MFSLSKEVTALALDISEWLLLACGAVLGIGIVGEYAKSDWWKKYLRLWQICVIAGVLGELLCDGGIFLFSRRLQTLEGADIAALNKKAEKSLADATEASRKAKVASDEADAAKLESGKAKDAASAAESLASGARKEADAFKDEIASARKAAAEADAKAEGFRLNIAGAQKDAADARKETARFNEIAERERLARVKLEAQMAWRRLTLEQQPQVASKIKQFSGQKYVLWSSAELEATSLCASVLNGLVMAGWVNIRPEPEGLINMGIGDTGMRAGIIVDSGIKIVVAQSRLADLGPAASALALALAAEGLDAKATYGRQHET